MREPWRRINCNGREGAWRHSTSEDRPRAALRVPPRDVEPNSGYGTAPFMQYEEGPGLQSRPCPCTRVGLQVPPASPGTRVRKTARHARLLLLDVGSFDYRGRLPLISRRSARSIAVIFCHSSPVHGLETAVAETDIFERVLLCPPRTSSMPETSDCIPSLAVRPNTPDCADASTPFRKANGHHGTAPSPASSGCGQDGFFERVPAAESTTGCICYR